MSTDIVCLINCPQAAHDNETVVKLGRCLYFACARKKKNLIVTELKVELLAFSLVLACLVISPEYGGDVCLQHVRF
jgi:hypothetical protein